MPTDEQKYQNVLEKNTFYFYNKVFQEHYEIYITSLTDTLLLLRNQIATSGLTPELLDTFLLGKENALKALLALTGFANESFKRLITVIRIANDPELSTVVYKNKWESKDEELIKEWSDNKILKLIKNNSYFRRGIVNLFLQGSTIPFLTRILPPFEIKKLRISKMQF